MQLRSLSSSLKKPILFFSVWLTNMVMATGSKSRGLSEENKDADSNTFSFQDWTSKLGDILNLKMKKTNKSAKEQNMEENISSDNDEFDSDTPLITM